MDGQNAAVHTVVFRSGGSFVPTALSKLGSRERSYNCLFPSRALLMASWTVLDYACTNVTKYVHSYSQKKYYYVHSWIIQYSRREYV
jgi:hypothetical protein